MTDTCLSCILGWHQECAADTDDDGGCCCGHIPPETDPDAAHYDDEDWAAQTSEQT